MTAKPNLSKSLYVTVTQSWLSIITHELVVTAENQDKTESQDGTVYSRLWLISYNVPFLEKKYKAKNLAL